MEVEELVTKFTADISDYRKKMQEMESELHSIAGITDKVKETANEALASNSKEMQKYGKQLQTLIKNQTKQTQAAMDSGKRLEDYRMKSKLLVAQLNQQKAELHRLSEAFHALNKQYDAQRAYLGDWDGGIEGVRKFREQITDTLHHAAAASEEAKQKLNTLSDLGFGDNDGHVQALKQQIDGYVQEIDRAKLELNLFDNELKEVGLDPKNLKTDSLNALAQQMQSVSAQMRQFREASEKTNAQLKSTNGSILAEEHRLAGLKDSLTQNRATVKSLHSRLSKLGNISVGKKLKNSFSGFWTVLRKIGTSAGSVFKKLHSGLTSVKGSAGGANHSLLNVVKSIRRIGVVSLGLKVCKSIFGELRSVISNYISQNEQLNNRVETLKNAFANALAPAMNVVVGLFEKLMPYALSVANAISDLFASIGISQSIHATTTAINGTTEATENLSEAQKDLYSFDQITKVSDDSSGSGSSGGSAGASAPSASSQFSKYLEEIKNLWKTGDFEGIGEQIAASCNKVISKINNLDWDGIQKKVNNAMSGIARVLNGFVKDFDWQGAGEIVGKGINTIVGAIDSFLVDFDFKALGEGFAKNFNGIFNTVDFKKIGKTLSDGISGLFNLISGFLETLDWSGLARDLEDLITGIEWGKIASSLFETIGAALGGLAAFFGTLIVDAFSSAKKYFSKKIEECGGSISAGILKGIADGLASIGKWIKDHIFQPFMSGFKKAFKINSPSKVMKTQGGYISQGLLDGIGNIWKKVKQKFTDFKQNLVAFFTGKGGLVTKVKNLGSKIVEGLKNGLKNLKSTFTKAFKGPLNGVIGLVNNMIEKINNKLSISIGSTLAKVLGALGVSVSAGKYQLFSIPYIPQLEQGGVLKKGQIGLLEGNGAEAVVPLEKNTGWITKVAMQLVNLTGGSNSNAPVNLTIPVYVGGKRITTTVLEDVNNTGKKSRTIPIQA